MTLTTLSSIELISRGALWLDFGVKSLAAKVGFVGVSGRTYGILNRTGDDAAIPNTSFTVVVKLSHYFWFLGARCESYRFTIDQQVIAMEEKQRRQ